MKLLRMKPLSDPGREGDLIVRASDFSFLRHRAVRVIIRSSLT